MSELALVALGIDSSGMKSGEQQAVSSLKAVEREMATAEKQADKLGKELGGSLNKGASSFTAFSGAAKNAGSSLQGLGGPLGQAAGGVSGLSGQVGGLVESFGLAGAGALAFVGAIAAVAAGFVKLSIAGAKAADELLDISEGTGLTVDQVQRLGAAMQRSGESVQGVERAFRQFQTTVVEAIRDPTSQAAQNLERLGVSATEAGRDTGKAFIETLAKLKELRSTTEGAVASNETFGRGIGSLVRGSSELNEILGKTRTELQAAGLIASDVALGGAAELDTQMNKLSQSFDTFKIQLNGLSGGAITTIFAGLTKALQELNGIMNEISNSPFWARFARGLLASPAAAVSPGLFGVLSAGGAAPITGDTGGTGGGGGTNRLGGGGGSRAGASLSDDLSAAAKRAREAFGITNLSLDELQKQTNATSLAITEQIRVLQTLARIPGAQNTKEYAQEVEKLSDLFKKKAVELSVLGTGLLPTSKTDTEALIRSLPLSQPPGVNEVGAVIREQTLGQGSKTTLFDDDQRAILTQQFDYIFEDFFRAIITGRATLKEAFGQLAEGILDTFATAMIQSMQKAFINPLVDGLTNLLTNALDGLFNGLAGGGLGKIFGGIGKLFGGFFADGGTLGAGKWGVAGERGPELIYSGSRPMQVMAGVMGGGGNVYVTNHFSIAAPNGRVERRSLDQISEASTSAIGRAQRNRGA